MRVFIILALIGRFLKCQPAFPPEDVALRHELVARYPVLNDSSSSLDAVRTLRVFAWETAVLPSASLITNSTFDRLSLSTRKTLFASNSVGVYCGGCNTWLRDLYRLFGYEAYVLNVGDTNTSATHVIALVRIQQGGKSVLCLQDAYFNYDIVDAITGYCMHFMDLQRSLMARNGNMSMVMPGAWPGNITANPKTVLLATDVPSIRPIQNPGSIYAGTRGFFSVIPSFYSFEISHLPDGREIYVYRSPRTLARFDELFSYRQTGSPPNVTIAPNWYMKMIVERGFPADLRWLFAIVGRKYQWPDVDQFMDEIQSIVDPSSGAPSSSGSPSTAPSSSGSPSTAPSSSGSPSTVSSSTGASPSSSEKRGVPLTVLALLGLSVIV